MITDRRSNPYKSLEDKHYVTKVNYSFFDVGHNVTDIDLEIAYLLLMEALYKIVSPAQLDLYTMDNIYVQNFEHNFKNEVMLQSTENLDQFVKNMHILAYEEKDRAQVVMVICASLYLATVALQFVFVVLGNLSVFSQSELMLLLPPRNCKEQERVAKDFLMVVRLENIDIDQISEDNCSYGSNADSVRTGGRRRGKKDYSTSVSKWNMDGRRFVCSVFSRLGYVWRSLLFLCLLGSYILVVHLLFLAHFDALMKINGVYENTILFNNHANGIQNGIMTLYVSPDQTVIHLTPYEYIQSILGPLFDYANYFLDVFSTDTVESA